MCIRKEDSQGKIPNQTQILPGGGGESCLSLCFGWWGLGWMPWQHGMEHPPPQHPAPEDLERWGGHNGLTPPDAPTTWHCQPEIAASNPTENGPFVSRLAVLGEQDWAHRRAFPRPCSSLCDSCWPLETHCGHLLASLPWQMVASLPFLPWACQLLLGMPYPVLLPEATPSNFSRQR